MIIFAFLFIGGLMLKSLLILIESSIDRLSLKYETKIISPPMNAEQGDFNPEKNVEIEIDAGSNFVKSLGKQIYMRTVS